MQTEPELNPVQASIMRSLYRSEGLRWSELNTNKLPSDHFSYHLRFLTRRGVVEKTSDGKYQLSAKGRVNAQLLETDSGHFISQGFVAVRIVIPKNQDGIQYFLLFERNGVPFRGKLSDPGGKVAFGKGLLEAAGELARAQTGLDCVLEQRGLAHNMFDYQGTRVMDSYHIVFIALSYTGQEKQVGPNGSNIWMSSDEIKASAKTVPGLSKLIDLACGVGPAFLEQIFEVEDF